MTVYPVVGGFFATRWAESGFAGMENSFGTSAIGALIDMTAQIRRATSDEFNDIDNDVIPDQIFVAQKHL